MTDQRYALVEPDKTIRGYSNEEPNVDQSELARHKPRWLPVVEAGKQPEYDSERSYISGPTATVENDEVVLRWDVVPISLDDRRDSMKRRVAQKRWEIETGGIEVEGMKIPTDRETQKIVSQTAQAYADGDIVGDIKFKTPEGFIQIGEDVLRAIKAAGARHVQACFEWESNLVDAIDRAKTHALLSKVDIETLP